MNQYEYSFNQELGLATNVIFKIYPEVSDVELAISEGKPASVIHRLATEAYQGVAETPIIRIEDSWWEQQGQIQAINRIIKTVNELVATVKIDSTGVSTPLTQEELDTNKVKLDKILADNNVYNEADLRSKLAIELQQYKTARDAIEADTTDLGPNSWLKNYRGVSDSVTRPTVTGTIPKSVRKAMIAVERNTSVRNVEDTLADLAKMNSLLFSVVAALYKAMPATTLNKIPAAEKGLIDYAMAGFGNITTRADKQLATEGTALVDKLFDREVAIADIVDRINKL